MMKSCRDCVHYKVCEEWAIDCFHGNTIFPYQAETAEEICEHYTPTADVAPKSEVAREIFAEIEKLFFANGVFIHVHSYNKLKKKYTEGEK